MKRLPLLPLLALGVSASFAQDINPSRQVVPNQFINPPGKRFSIFAGDPERVQKANEINFKDFKAELEIVPTSIPLTPTGHPDEPATLKVTFRVKNISEKKSYTLSFPDSQRYDIVISSGNNNAIYRWSADKLFEQKIGAGFLNPREVLSWTENIPLEKITAAAGTGIYTVKAVLANYPEITATAKLTVTP